MNKWANARFVICGLANLLKGILLGGLLVLAVVFGATAQKNVPIISIIRSESQSFPRVSAYFAATDENGTPLGAVQAGGLTRDTLIVLEGTFGTPAEIIAVERHDFQDLRLVLVLDISTTEAYLQTIKEAAQSFIDELEPRDKVALIALYNEVRILQRDFTNNHAELKATIDALEVEGDRTTLNEAVFEGVNIAATAPENRRAVIVMTNARNNIGDFSADTAIDAAQEHEVPVYIINFEGDAEIRPDPIKDMLGATGGKAFIISSAEKIAESLQATENLIRTGYKVTFRSRLEADDREYGWALGVVHRGARAVAEGSFVAVEGRVEIVPNVAEGQKVGSIVPLDAEITAPADIALVEYMLDGRLLARFEPRDMAKPSYRFHWDSTTASIGAHRLVIKAVDEAGNEGTATINLKVVPPLMVALRIQRNGTTTTRFQATDTITLVAKVDAIEEVERVDFWLNDELLGSVKEGTNGLYTLSLEGDEKWGGAYIFTARARDVRRQEGEDRVDVEIVAVEKTPTPQPSPPSTVSMDTSPRTGEIDARRLFSALVIVISTAAVVLLALIFIWMQKARYREIRQLKVSNEGNISSSYALHATDPVNALQFDFMLNGMVLPEWEIVEEVKAEETEEVVETVPEVPAVQERTPDAEKTTPEQVSTVSELRESVDTARLKAGQERGKEALKRSTQAGKVAGNIASLLPAPMRAPFNWLSRMLRLPSMKATRVTTLAKSNVSRVKNVATSATKLREPLKPEKGAKPAAPSTKKSPPPPSDEVPTERGAAGRSPRQAADSAPSVKREPRIVRTVMEGWHQTSLLEPGESLMLDLIIAPFQRLRRTQNYVFTIVSKAIEHEDDHVKISANIEIRGISWIRYYLLPALILAAMTLIIIAMVWVLLAVNDISQLSAASKL